MAGSMRERRPGVWELPVFVGRDASGKVRHRNATFHGTKRAAERELTRLIAEEDATDTTALPGGYGTLEELTEVLTWSQLGLHAKPCGLLDVAGYYGALLAFFDHAVAERFVRPEHRRLLLTGTEPGHLLDAMAAWSAPPPGEKWLDREVPLDSSRPDP